MIRNIKIYNIPYVSFNIVLYFNSIMSRLLYIQIARIFLDTRRFICIFLLVWFVIVIILWCSIPITIISFPVSASSPGCIFILLPWKLTKGYLCRYKTFSVTAKFFPSYRDFTCTWQCQITLCWVGLNISTCPLEKD